MQRITERDIDTLARTLYGEAEANNAADAKAIAWVVVNRARHARWPDSVAEVCLQPFQFSCWNANDPNRARILAARSSWFQRCREIALGVLNGEIADPTSVSTHYYATFVKQPKWAKGKKPVYRVTHAKNHEHLFFNDIDTKPPTTPREALDQVNSLSSSRTMAGATVVTASGAGAIAVGAAQQVADAAPAVAVVSQVAETAHNHPSGLMIAFGLVVIAAGLYIAWARYSDRKRGIR
jgi:hypothetical protein